jgi:glycolate oxidase iron-sulfur subunit
MPETFGAVHRASLRVLARNGFEVSIPRRQGCCGALQAHSGDLDFARELARENARVLCGDDIDAIVVNSAGCGAAMREAEHWLGSAGSEYARKVRDISEFLHEAGLREPPHPVNARVCYDDPCHLIHAQRVESAPRELLESIPGLKLVPHREASACCGAAGIYNLTHRAMSMQVLERKMDALAEADPDFIASGNPGCLMQLQVGVRAREMRARVLHPVELLDWAYTGAGPT